MEAKINKEIEELVDLYWQLYDQLDHKGEAEIEARIWAKERELFTLKCKAAAAASAPSANPPAHNPHPGTSQTQLDNPPSDSAVSPPTGEAPVEPRSDA